MPKYAGVDENGKSMFYKDKLDENGNIIGRETTTTRVRLPLSLCTALPWAYGGFGTRFSYKGFDLAVDFNYQLGGQITIQTMPA